MLFESLDMPELGIGRLAVPLIYKESLGSFPCVSSSVVVSMCARLGV